MSTRRNLRFLPLGTASASRADKGLALVVTLSLTALLTVLVVGLLALSASGIRGSSSHRAQTIARANARMALMLAIGDLQKATGPDQRVTMTSGLQTGTEPANPNWTGAADVSPSALAPDAKATKIHWLVSGEPRDPSKVLTKSARAGQGDALKVGSYRAAAADGMVDLLAPLVNIDQGSNRGRLAWWVGDEGTKARVDVAKPKNPPSTELDRLARSGSPLQAGLENLGEPWARFAPAAEKPIDRNTMVSLQTASLASGIHTLASDSFNDLTTGGYGLPVNVAAGGMKADLSLIFDRSQIASGFGETYCGATPSATTWNEAKILAFATRAPAKFFLSDTLSGNGSRETGPNWGTLWNYATLWQSAAGHQMSMVGGHPLVEADLRYKTWIPYTGHDAGEWRRDIQHRNHPVTPVLSLFQMGFRLNSELDAAAGEPGATPLYRAQIGIQPVVGLWNPYNIAIKAAPYRFDWALYPYFRFNFAKPTGTGSFTDGRLTHLWLREEWTAGTTVIPTPESGGGGKWLMLETPPVDLQPGEFRIFSVLDRVRIRAGQVYSLKPGWSENGAFVVDLKDATGNVRLVPQGYRAWFGDIVLLDTQATVTRTRFPSLDMSAVSSTWFTLKSGNNVLLRSTELFNGGNDPGTATEYRVPEPVVSGSSGGLDTTKTTYLIEDLAGDGVTPNIATWSFFLRTSSQIEAPDEDQGLRGWIDSNPRALVTNSLWDGSSISSSGERTGWHATSHYMGAWNAPGKPKVVGDGRGGNRGLLCEGGSAPSEPEVNRAGGRYQGFGGAANTLAGGRTHVIVYDVPRAPLVSIGQFQHAHLARYNFEPGFVVGNSYANPRIPLGATVQTDFNGIRGLSLCDISHEVNRRLFDGYFFSTLGLDYVGTSGSSFDAAFDIRKLASGASSLPNPRMVFSPLPGELSIDKILAGSAERAPEAIAARILVKGAFNVNSTSKTAWKAVLSSLGTSELPVLDPSTGEASWQDPEGIRFNRFGHVLSGKPYDKGGPGDDDPFWQGWRNLSEAELDLLAAEIVKEVKARGPFRSMAEFVNRNPKAAQRAHQLKGPLQAALDRAINAGFPASVGRTATQPPGNQFSAAVDGEHQAAGNASYLMQGDVLQSLAPILQVRSDYFMIRTCGEALNADGKAIARAWCEAFVQRTADYVDPRDACHLAPGELASAVNRNFGRRYRIVSFRWLSGPEI